MKSARSLSSDFQTFQRAFTQHIRHPQLHAAPAGVEAKRMRVYTELLYANVESFLLKCFPVLRLSLGKRAWQKLVRAFFAEHPCQSPLFREIPKEFVGFLQTHAIESTLAPLFIRELAHYEWVELALASAVPPKLPALHARGDLSADRPWLAPVHALLRYTYPVHRLGHRRLARRVPDQPTYLLVFRNSDFAVKFIKLNAMSARLVDLLESGRYSGKTALRKITRELRHPQPQAVLESGLRTLAELKAAGAIIGFRRPQA